MQFKHEVILNFFQDEANGEYGLTHPNTCDSDSGNGFNAFWSGILIFHDVFEHYHEFSQYFRGEYALNIGGEMVASGATWYYYDIIGLHGVRELNNRSIYSFQENIRFSTESLIQDNIYCGNNNYGNELMSNVPYQKPIDNEELEYQIKELVKNVKDFKYQYARGEQYFEDSEYETAVQWKQSVTFRKIANLHRYGYRMAQKLIPDNQHNQNKLRQFIEQMNAFTKNVSAEELTQVFKSMVFTITRNKGLIDYGIELISLNPSEISNYTLGKNQTHFEIYEAYVEYAEEEA